MSAKKSKRQKKETKKADKLTVDPKAKGGKLTAEPVGSLTIEPVGKLRVAR